MLVDVVTCGECEDFEVDSQYPHMGRCYNYEVMGSDGEPYVSRNADDYCSFGVRKEEKK